MRSYCGSDNFLLVMLIIFFGVIYMFGGDAIYQQP